MEMLIFVKKNATLIYTEFPNSSTNMLGGNEADDINILKSRNYVGILHQFVRDCFSIKSISIIEEEINIESFGQKRKKK
jgi:hypothetical protein